MVDLNRIGGVAYLETQGLVGGLLCSARSWSQEGIHLKRQRKLTGQIFL